MSHYLSSRLYLALFFALLLSACDISGEPNPNSPVVVNGPSIIDFNASPLGDDGSATLSWRVSKATSLMLDQGVGDVTGESSVSVSPTTTTTYTLSATNSEGTDQASVTVTVSGSGNPGSPNENVAPTVTIGAVEAVTLEDGSASVSLDASVQDPDSEAFTYTWNVTEGEAERATLQSRNSEDTGVSFSAAGIYTLRLTVSDGDEEGTASVNIEVKEEKDSNPGEPENPSTITVTSTSGAALLPDECTLRAAITAANTDEAVGGCGAGSGADTLVLVEGATYTLREVDSETDRDAGIFGDQALPVISSEINLQGSGSTIEIQEDASDLNLLYIAEGGNLTLQSVTLDGKADGSVLENQGTASLIESTVTTSTGSAFLVYNGTSGILTLRDSNVVDSPYTGIVNEGTLKLERSRIENNGSPLDVNNGGIQNSGGKVTLIDSIIRGNVGEATGGISNFGETLQGVESRAVLEITRSVISGNYAAENGAGALFNTKGDVTVLNSTFSSNEARTEDIGAHTLENAADATMSIASSTILVENAPGLEDRPPYPAVVNGGTLLLKSTIIDGDDERQISCANDTPITSQGYNLDSDGSCNLSQATDLSEVDPLLGALQDNGGPTQTHALQEGSPALDALPTSVCEVDTDQRGVSRPQGEACDIGAFEREE